MWLVLLDYSGSMDDEFEAGVQRIQSLGRTRTFEVEKKWEAAKKSFLLELKRLPEDMEVLLLGFTSQVQIIHSGLASDVDEFEKRLEEISPTNGTDIGNAIRSVRDYLNKRPQVLLITDGKSDLENAKAEARFCANADTRIDVLIIDPTNVGVEMARAIAGITQGRWEIVTSAKQLENLTQESADDHQFILARAEKILQEADEEFTKINRDNQAHKNVTFSAGYPSRIDANQKYPFIVYIHLDHLKPQIEEFLKKEIATTGIVPSCSSTASSTRIPIGTLITIKPNIPDVFSNPPQQDVVWMEDYHKAQFEIRYTGNNKSGTICSGFVDIFADGVLVGNIPVSLAVTASANIGDFAEPSISMGQSFTRIFASYAHEDAAVVYACKETYRLLGIHLYVDRDDLLSGQPWRKAIQKLIATSDLFQLYWSKNSAESIEVEKEWRLALQVGELRSNNFVRPFYWQEPLISPPKELGYIHFAYLDTKKLQIDAEYTLFQEYSNKEEYPEIEAIFPVISITEAEKTSSVKVLQKSIGQAVSFIEKLTGLRYYPPTTLLVDDYIVENVRSHLTVDRNSEIGNVTNQSEIDYILDILQSLALEFHVHHLEPDGEYHNEAWLKDYFNLEMDEDLGDFTHVRMMCEYLFMGPVKKYIEGIDPFESPSNQRSVGKLTNIINKIIDNRVENWLKDELRRDIVFFYDVAEIHEKKLIENVFGKDELAAILDEETALQDDQLRRIAYNSMIHEYISATEKYRNGFSDYFYYHPKTTLCSMKSFIEYLDKWFTIWINYLKIIKEKNDVFITVGYHVEEKSLLWLKSIFPDLEYEIEPEWIISTQEILTVVERLSSKLIDALSQIGDGSERIRQYFVQRAHAYGIFANAESQNVASYLLDITKKQNWPTGLALEGNHKILLCANAFERYKLDLSKLGVNQSQIEKMAEWFMIATLVHEHLHGILATGVDQYGKSSWASKDWDEWQKGNLLNESLAAWAELHFFRGNETMMTNITEYIQAGEYPDWPYRGADKIEKIYQDQGIKGVRILIKQLREDPQYAQQIFDKS